MNDLHSSSLDKRQIRNTIDQKLIKSGEKERYFVISSSLNFSQFQQIKRIYKTKVGRMWLERPNEIHM